VLQQKETITSTYTGFSQGLSSQLSKNHDIIFLVFQAEGAKL